MSASVAPGRPQAMFEAIVVVARRIDGSAFSPDDDMADRAMPTCRACGALGFAPPNEVSSAATSASLGESVAQNMSAAAEQSQSDRWWLLITGIALVIWFA